MLILLVIFISVLSFFTGFTLAKKPVLPVKHKLSLESSKDEEYENFLNYDGNIQERRKNGTRNQNRRPTRV